MIFTLIYIYIYTHTHTHTHIYIHTNIHIYIQTQWIFRDHIYVCINIESPFLLCLSLQQVNNAKKYRKTIEWERLEITESKLEIPRGHFMQRWAQ